VLLPLVASAAGLPTGPIALRQSSEKNFARQTRDLPQKPLAL